MTAMTADGVRTLVVGGTPMWSALVSEVEAHRAPATGADMGAP